jgi:copper chaperone CopZ
MQSVTFDIQGMHCAGCAQTIDHLLRRQAGVWEAEVSHEAAGARVLFDPDQVSADQLAEAVRRAGYSTSERPA